MAIQAIWASGRPMAMQDDFKAWASGRPIVYLKPTEAPALIYLIWTK